MRTLGIDYGDKRVGVAVSDEDGKFAFPLVVLKNTKSLLFEISEIIKDKEVGLVVVGESLNYAGEPNLIMKDIDRFVEELKEETALEVIYEPEFLTSVQAEKIQGKNQMLDASAAALILQSYLDREK